MKPATLDLPLTHVVIIEFICVGEVVSLLLLYLLSIASAELAVFGGCNI